MSSWPRWPTDPRRRRRRLLPDGTGFGSLLLIAVLATALAALLTNLSATLLLVPLLAPLGTSAVLAALLGLNIGSGLTWTGSLANLLWRRTLIRQGTAGLREFHRVSLGHPVRSLAAVACWPSSPDPQIRAIVAVQPQMRHDGRVTTYRLAEAAELLGVSDDTVRRWVDAGRLATHQTPAAPPSPAPTSPRWPSRCSTSPTATAPGPAVSARNRLPGIVTRVKKDTVMAQVEMVCGPYRMVSLMSADAADELGLEPGRARDRLGEVHQRRDREPVTEAPHADPPAQVSAAVALGACARSWRRRLRRRGGAHPHRARRRLADRRLRGPGRRVRGRRTRASTVELSFGSSTDLAEQVADGAPGDVLATADETTWQPRTPASPATSRRPSPPTCSRSSPRPTTPPASSRSTTSRAT